VRGAAREGGPYRDKVRGSMTTPGQTALRCPFQTSVRSGGVVIGRGRLTEETALSE
jgi:hypothetical protein